MVARANVTTKCHFGRTGSKTSVFAEEKPSAIENGLRISRSCRGATERTTFVPVFGSCGLNDTHNDARPDDPRGLSRRTHPESICSKPNLNAQRSVRMTQTVASPCVGGARSCHQSRPLRGVG